MFYKLGKIDRMRIFVECAQAYSEYSHVGQTCSVQVRELPSRAFTATVTRLADAIPVPSAEVAGSQKRKPPKHTGAPKPSAVTRSSATVSLGLLSYIQSISRFKHLQVQTLKRQIREPL